MRAQFLGDASACRRSARWTAFLPSNEIEEGAQRGHPRLLHRPRDVAVTVEDRPGSDRGDQFLRGLEPTATQHRITMSGTAARHEAGGRCELVRPRADEGVGEVDDARDTVTANEHIVVCEIGMQHHVTRRHQLWESGKESPQLTFQCLVAASIALIHEDAFEALGNQRVLGDCARLKLLPWKQRERCYRLSEVRGEAQSATVVESAPGDADVLTWNP